MSNKFEKVNNYSLLIKDYEYVTRLIKQLPKEEFEIFFDKFTYCMSKQINAGNKLYSMLLFYNLYKNYRISFFDMEIGDISLIINTLLFFIDEQKIDLLDKSISFAFNKPIFNELKSISNGNELLDNMIDITDNYLNCPKFSSCYYALYKIDELKKEIIYKDNDNIEEKLKKV